MSRINYDTMQDAKLIYEAMKRESREDRENSKFFTKQKNRYCYWLHWYFGMVFDYIVTENVEDENKDNNLEK